MTPALATSESTTADGRTFHTRPSRAKSARESAAAMTTAASAEFGRSARRPLKNSEQQHDDTGADDAGKLALGPRLLGDRGT